MTLRIIHSLPVQFVWLDILAAGRAGFEWTTSSTDYDQAMDRHRSGVCGRRA
ncbi:MULTISPECIES: hypothetical protein [unclassified Mesorhizobium]|uniref:hypothetical protein n=1 Tax=unclassified Mesorhizobium TaxID=325217 RepID=UPI001AEBCC31|nr:hypothetical protein [Mesorhizobium sp. LSHC420B00]